MKRVAYDDWNHSTDIRDAFMILSSNEGERKSSGRLMNEPNKPSLRLFFFKRHSNPQILAAVAVKCEQDVTKPNLL